LTAPIAGEWADDNPLNVATPEEAAAAVDNVAQNLYALDGQLGALTMWWGPPIVYEPGVSTRENGPLRIDLWGETGHAAVRWEPTGEIGVDPDAPAAEVDMMVMESSEAPMVTVPASVIRCTVDTARRVAAEWAQTGKRPTCVEWVPPHG